MSTSEQTLWPADCNPRLNEQARPDSQERTMTIQADNTKKPVPDSSVPDETPAERRLDRAADEAAQKASKTEQRYDRDHNIFTK
jgi:hypothetical protein